MASSTTVRRILPSVREGSQTDLIIRRFVRNKLAMAGLVMTIFYFIIAIIGPILAPYDPTATAAAARLQPPSVAHPMGTDQLGRDLLSRVLHGARYSAFVGTVVVVAATALGVTVGLLAGYFGGLVDGFFMRCVDVLFAFPNILLALVIVAVLGTGLFNVVVALGLAYAIPMSRITRGSAISVREEEYIMAANSYGEKTYYIMFREMLPNMVSSVVVQATLIFAFAVIAEASLSYLGLSAQPPTPTWGVLVADGQDVISIAPWEVIFPALALSYTILSLTFLGVGLRDAFDPQTDEESDAGGAM